MKNKPAKNLHAVALGSLGGAAGTGKAKARTSEQARAAALAMHAKRRAELKANGKLGGRPKKERKP